MGLRSNTSSGYQLCNFHRQVYVVSALNYKQRIIANTGYIILFQFLAGIWWWVNQRYVAADPTWEWRYYFAVFGSLWPTYYLTAWIVYCWKFRGKRWACNPDNEAGNDDYEAIDNNDDDNAAAIIVFPTNKFSNN